MRFLELFSLFAFAFIPGVFVLEFDANLHCSQWTSFRIAVFDPVPHEEELPAPLVYRPPYRDALRSVLAVVLLVFLFAPFACLCCVARRWWKATSARWALYSAFTLLVVVRLIPERIIGERFSALYSAAAVLGLMLYGAAFWLLVRHQRSGEFLADPR
jgi:hypothetical protein